MKKQIAILLISLTFAFPAFAQEATQAAPESTESPVVVVESPAPPVPSANQFESLVPVFGLVMLLGLLIQSVLLYRSTPPENKEQVRAEILKQVRELIEESRRIANTTPSPVDNRAVDGAEALVNFFDRPSVEVPATTTVTTTTTTAPIEEAQG
jgi:hypothetical protein